MSQQPKRWDICGVVEHHADWCIKNAARQASGQPEQVKDSANPAVLTGPKTVAAARALPEVNLLGEKLFLGAGKLEGDTICSFVDTDGRAMSVHCIRRTPDGPDEWVKALP